MNPEFLNSILERDRFLKILYETLPNEIFKENIYHIISNYLSDYANFNSLSVDEVIKIYSNFVKVFNKHCKEFSKTGLYPFEKDSIAFNMSRIEYDIVLIMSVLFTPHRYRIIQLLTQKIPAKNGLFIGLGPGLELLLTQDEIKNIDTYDVSANAFLSKHFPKVTINAELYKGQAVDYYDAIYMIELLEHLENPYELISICYKSLKKGGKVILTTATDIPQFDHLYNFPLDHSQFEKQMKEIGFTSIFKEKIDHNYMVLEINPCNHFYIFQK